jgi:hypothetical protein
LAGSGPVVVPVVVVLLEPPELTPVENVVTWKLGAAELGLMVELVDVRVERAVDTTAAWAAGCAVLVVVPAGEVIQFDEGMTVADAAALACIAWWA